eukprot:GHUV01015868.1.p1 GENE.GHUV01015868.1~~GHUV01015868.1.p1  ORF type:complete len:363 (+),score=63.17 GHUV01015868.1:131-1090(+)
MSYGQSQDANGSLLLGVYEKLTSASGHARDASSSLVAKDPSVRACDSRDRNEMEVYNNTAGQAMTAPSKPAGGAKRGGRPVTWIGGGGLDAKKLAGLGVPMLRSLFNQVFGEPTASNNAGWLRRKLSESPDSVHGQRRSAIVRARDSGAAIWNSALPQVMPGGCGDGVDGMECDVMECDGEAAQEHAAGEEAAAAAGSALLAHYACDAGGRRSLKRSSTSAESADTLGYRGSGNNMHCPSSPSECITARGMGWVICTWGCWLQVVMESAAGKCKWCAVQQEPITSFINCCCNTVARLPLRVCQRHITVCSSILLSSAHC